MHGQETKVKQVRENRKFRKVSNWNSISKSLGSPGKLAFIKYLMDAYIKAEFVNSLRDNELTSSYLLASESISSSSYLKDERIIRKAQADLAINGYQKFRSHSGDSYVSETTNGGRFLASVKLVFA